MRADAADPSVSNVTVSQRTDGTQIVDIYYDLADSDSSTLWVGVAVSENGGTWYGITPTNLALSGDVGGNMTPGTGKHIIWNSGRDLAGKSGTSYRVAIIADDGPSRTAPKPQIFGCHQSFRQATGNKRFIDGFEKFEIDGTNYASQWTYRFIGPDGQPVVSSENYQVLHYKQPDSNTREWWYHTFRQKMEAGLDFFAYDTWGQRYSQDLDGGSYETNPSFLGDSDFCALQADYGAKAFARMIDETGIPLKVALFVEIPAGYNDRNWDRMRAHYGIGQYGPYQWLDNGQDPDHIIERMPITVENVRRYWYELIIRPFYANFNRPEDRKHWQTHNDAPIEQGGRPIIIIYAPGTQWFTNLENGAIVTQAIKDWFEGDFGVVPFMVINYYWADQLTGQALTDFLAVADTETGYMSEWVWESLNPPAPNYWTLHGYKSGHVTPGIDTPPGYWRPQLDPFKNKRWTYVDGTTGADETYFMSREWQTAVTNLQPALVLIGHWNDNYEGENIALMDNYEAKAGGYLSNKGYYLDYTRNMIRNYRGNGCGRAIGYSSADATFDGTNPSHLPPVAEFTASSISGSAPLRVGFVDLSSNSPTSRAWDFTNDGSTDSTAKDPWYVFTNPGTYTVKLTAANAYGSDVETKTAFITVTDPEPLVAQFSPWPIAGPAPLTVKFLDESRGKVTNWAWDFENNGTTDSVEQNPAYRYNTLGTYTVKLTVSNAQTSDAEIKYNHIVVGGSQTLKADFSASPLSGDAPLTVYFTDQSKWAGQWDSATMIRSWEWDFDTNGAVDSRAQNPVHTYISAGTYAVKLRVNTAGGYDDEVKTAYITVREPGAVPALEITNAHGGTIAKFDSQGNLTLWGTLARNSTPSTTHASDFIVRSSGGAIVAALDVSGNLVLAGATFENQTSLSPPPRSLIVKNTSGQVVAYISPTGNLYLRGQILSGT